MVLTTFPGKGQNFRYVFDWTSLTGGDVGTSVTAYVYLSAYGINGVFSFFFFPHTELDEEQFKSS